MARRRPNENPFELPSDDAGLILFLDEKREKSRRRLPELQMKLNLAFTLGHQYMRPDEKNRTLHRTTVNTSDPNAPVRLPINKMGGIVERAVSKLTKENPLPECRPASDDDNDVQAAKTGTRMLTHELDRLRWGNFLTRFMFWPTILGWSYVQVTWDADGGDLFDLDVESADPVHEGDIVIDEVPAFELAVDPNARTLHDARWAVRTRTMTKEAVWEQYDVIVANAKPCRDLVDEVIQSVESQPKSTKGEEADTVAVHTFWLRPGSRMHAPGMVVTWCGTTILDKVDVYPYEHGRLPFVQVNLLPGLGPREGRTWVNDLIPMQVDYNDARSREATVRKNTNPKILAPTNSIDTRRLSSRVDVVPYKAVAGKPEWMMPPNSWLQQHETTMQRSDSEMGERSGIAEAGSQDAASNMPAAAILALQEQSDVKLAISAKELAGAIGDVGWQMLRLIQQFWLEERLVRTWSEEGDLEAKRFAGADVQNVLDVHVNAESALPRSKAARTEIMVQLQESGLFPDPRLFLRALDVPGMEWLIEHLNVDAKRAQRENSRLKEGINCPTYHFDNHVIHLTEHNNFRKTQEYEAMPPAGKAVFDAHCAVHEGFIIPQQQVPDGQTPTLDAGQQVPAAGTPAAMAPPGPEGTSPAGGAPMYTNPMGGVNDPLSVAAGQAPSALTGSAVAKRAGIGASGQPGAVPGISRDSQAASMGR